MFKKIILLSLCMVCSLTSTDFTSEHDEIDKIDESKATNVLFNNRVLSSEQSKVKGVFFQAGTFYVLTDKVAVPVKVHNLHPLLRGIKFENLCKLLESGKFLVKISDDNEYSVAIRFSLRGGGILGANAGFWIGKSAVYIGSQGCILAVAGVATAFGTPIAGKAVYFGLTKATLPAVESASNAVGIGTAVTFGTATGPV